MTKLKQVDAVYQATVKVLTENGVKFEDHTVDVDTILTDEMRASINMVLCAGFTSGSIDLKDTPSNQAKLADPKLLKSYVSGLISNWYGKDKRLNGNVDHEIKNPGSRAFSSDPQLKSLRALLAMKPHAAEEIQGYIDARIATLTAERAPKAKAIKVDVDNLPEELKHLA
jgi:hypothetical protein